MPKSVLTVQMMLLLSMSGRRLGLQFTK